MEKMKALVVYGIKQVKLEEVPVPECKENEVLIQVKACGICGSDIGRVMQGSGHVYPIILGHEFSGRVVKVGTNVKDFKVNDRVTVAPLYTCGKCEYCKMGKPALCESYRLIGTRINGAMAEYVSVNSDNVLKLPDNIDYLSGAMIEPLTVAIHAVDRVFVQTDATVAIFGAGTIGMLILQCLKARGAGKVYVIDIVDKKLDLASQLGADVVLNSLDIDVADYFKKQGKVDVVFETAGNPVTQRQSFNVVKKLGKIVFVGTAIKNLELEAKTFENILRGELHITGSWMSYSSPFPGYEWRAAINYLNSGKIKTTPLITHTFKLEDGIKAFEVLSDNKNAAIKGMFVFD